MSPIRRAFGPPLATLMLLWPAPCFSSQPEDDPQPVQGIPWSGSLHDLLQNQPLSARDSTPRAPSQRSPGAGRLPGAEWPGRVPDAERSPDRCSGAIPEAPASADPLSGTWRLLSNPSRTYHGAVYDPPRRRLLLFGGRLGYSHNDVWALPFTGPPKWVKLATAGAPPMPRDGASVLYDPLRDRMIVAGGSSGSTYLMDVWALSLSGQPTWEQLQPGGAAPEPRTGQSYNLDTRRNRLLMWGGAGYPDCNRYYCLYHDHDDLWELTLGDAVAWRQLSPQGAKPPARAYHTAVYDEAQDRALIFSGYADETLDPYVPAQSFRDAWQLDLSGDTRWTELHPSGSLPPGRVGHTAVYDPARQQMIIIGGLGIDVPRGIYWSANDVWSLGLSGEPAWSELSPLGKLPYVMPGHTSVLDPVGGLILVTGGILTAALSLGDETPAWTVVTPLGSPPAISYGHDAVYDPLGDRMIAFGGYNAGGLRDFAYLNGTWVLPLEGDGWWDVLATGGTPPAKRYGHSCVYDSRRRRMVVFAGSDDNVHFNDTWTLALTGPPVWTRLATGGEPPPARRGHTAIYDPVGDRMIVFGGQNGPGVRDFMNDAWALSLGDRPTWTRLEPSGALPSPRSEHVSIYDPRRHRMIVQGGATDGGTRDEVWLLTLDGTLAWSEPPVAGAHPGECVGHAGIYDAVRDRMVIQDGKSGAFALSLGEPMTWTQLRPEDEPPPRMWMESGVYDAVNDQAVFFNGNGTWAVTWDRPQEQVAVDFKPDHGQDIVNPVALGVSHLAILGSARFDATVVDPATIHAPGIYPGDDQARQTGPAHARDVNGDGFPDLIASVRTADLDLLPGDSTIVVEGETVTGHRFRGSDKVRLVPAAHGPAARRPGSPGPTRAGEGVDPAHRMSVTSGPAGRELTVRLNGSGPAVIELFDVAGRRRDAHRVDDIDPGVTARSFALPVDLAPGVYLVRLSQGGRQAFAKVAVLE